MGSYQQEQNLNKYCEEYKEEFELKITDIKKIFNIPFLYIKESKYERVYPLFNLVPLVSEIKGES